MLWLCLASIMCYFFVLCIYMHISEVCSMLSFILVMLILKISLLKPLWVCLPVFCFLLSTYAHKKTFPPSSAPTQENEICKSYRHFPLGLEILFCLVLSLLKITNSDAEKGWAVGQQEEIHSYAALSFAW